MGIDQRGELYRQPLLDAGIGIFEVDFKTGIYAGPPFVLIGNYH